jgi:hypothetical protein
MNEPESAPPGGRDEVASASLGEAQRVSARERGGGERPDLDERERRIATRRKPMGPPLEEPVEPREDTRDVPGADEPPVDPADAEDDEG